MSFVNSNVRYQPPLNDVLDEVDALKDRIIRMENSCRQLEKSSQVVKDIGYSLRRR